jgi:tetratricopeptide (TPR) repeat protein
VGVAVSDAQNRSRRSASVWLDVGRVAAIGGLLVAVCLLQSHIDDRFGAYRSTEEILYVENGELLEKATVGFESLAADIYWLRAVQYFGGKRREAGNKDYSLLAPLLGITVSLDPHFKIAYTYGATFLSEPLPVGAGLPLKGIELIDEGIRAHPDYWRFYLDKGFIYFWYLNDYEKAAEVFLEGSKIQGAPDWMAYTAARALTRGGDRETARNLWRIFRDTAETPQQKDNADAHLRQLDALDQMDVLKSLIERYHEQRGDYPARWEDLVDARLLKAIPHDPTGEPYVLDPETHEVSPSRRSGLGVLPTE